MREIHPGFGKANGGRREVSVQDTDELGVRGPASLEAGLGVFTRSQIHYIWTDTDKRVGTIKPNLSHVAHKD